MVLKIFVYTVFQYVLIQLIFKNKVFTIIFYFRYPKTINAYTEFHNHPFNNGTLSKNSLRNWIDLILGSKLYLPHEIYGISPQCKKGLKSMEKALLFPPNQQKHSSFVPQELWAFQS